jgi:hypothetical protein
MLLIKWVTLFIWRCVSEKRTIETKQRYNRINSNSLYRGGIILLDIEAGVRLAALYNEETSYCRRVTAQELALRLILSVFL